MESQNLYTIEYHEKELFTVPIKVKNFDCSQLSRLYLFERIRTKFLANQKASSSIPIDRIFFTKNPKKIFKSYHLVALLNILSSLSLFLEIDLFDKILANFCRVPRATCYSDLRCFTILQNLQYFAFLHFFQPVHFMCTCWKFSAFADNFYTAILATFESIRFKW